MYKILGGDGKEYGPVSADTLRQWVNEGRANAMTQVQLEGTSGWVSLGQVAEFGALFAAPLPPTAGAPLMGGATVSTGQAAQMVAGPAIGLIVTAALGAVGQLVSMLFNILGTGLVMASPSAQGQPPMPAWMHLMSGGVGVVFSILGIIMSVIILMGALKMKKLEAYNFAMTATIIAMVPCISPCCFVGLPVGIWALVVLLKPEVKAAFLTN